MIVNSGNNLRRGGWWNRGEREGEETDIRNGLLRLVSRSKILRREWVGTQNANLSVFSETKNGKYLGTGECT